MNWRLGTESFEVSALQNQALNDVDIVFSIDKLFSVDGKVGRDVVVVRAGVSFLESGNRNACVVLAWEGCEVGEERDE